MTKCTSPCSRTHPKKAGPNLFQLGIICDRLSNIYLSFQVGKETTQTATEVQQPSTSSWHTGGTALEEMRTEKPETRLGSLSSQAGAIHQEQQQPVATKRYAAFWTFSVALITISEQQQQQQSDIICKKIFCFCACVCVFVCV